MQIKLSRVAIISGDPEHAESLCRHFRRSEIYVLLFEAPMERMEEYNVFQNDCVFVANTIGQAEVEAVLFSECSAKVVEFITPMLMRRGCSIHNILGTDELSKCPGYRDKENCVPTREGSGAVGNVVVIEEGNPMATVIARNLAVAMNGCLVCIPHVNRRQKNAVEESWRAWSVESGVAMDDARVELTDFILKQLRGLNRESIASATFITNGIPYGLLPFQFPVTHLFVFPLLGVSIASGLIKSAKNSMRSPVAVLIDPQNTEHSERDSVARAFAKKGYLVRQAVGESATTVATRYLTESMPADILFYSTHCGEVKGQRVSEILVDAQGNSHTLVYERVINLSRTPDTEMIEVIDLKRFVSIDGVSWRDDDGKTRIGAKEIMEQFIAQWRSAAKQPFPGKFSSVVECGDVQFSDCLKTSDGVYKPFPQTIGSFSRPIVFNNACSSSRELSSWFICKGASNYIGTTRDIPDSLSAAVARSFASLVSRGAFVGRALYDSQQCFTRDLGYSPYLLFGCAFTNLSVPPNRQIVRAIVHSKIEEALFVEKMGVVQNEAHQRQLNSRVQFLESELLGLRVSIQREY